jgi:predicted aspartyl protease
MKIKCLKTPAITRIFDQSKSSHMAVLAMLLFALVTMAQPVVAKSTTVPAWKDDDGRPRVEVYFENGQSFNFIVDTGMMKTIILPELVEALKLTETGQDVVNPHGNKVKVSAYPSLAVKIGGMIDYLINAPESLTNLKISEETVYGVLGSEFLQQFTVGFDLEAGIMILSDTGVEDMFGDVEFATLPMQSPYANLWMTETMIGPVTATAFLDTGANGTLVNPLVVQRMSIENYSRLDSVKTEVKGPAGIALENYNVLINEISADSRLWTDTRVTVVSAVFTQLRLANTPAVLIGSDLLLSGRLIMDYPEGLVYFELKQDS